MFYTDVKYIQNIFKTRGETMPDYKEMYFALYREVTKVIEQLQEIQQKTEEMYIQSEDRLILFEDKKEK